MLYYLSLLTDWFGPLNVFQYVTFRTVGAAMTSFGFCLWIGPAVIDALHRLKLGQPLKKSLRCIGLRICMKVSREHRRWVES